MNFPRNQEWSDFLPIDTVGKVSLLRYADYLTILAVLWDDTLGCRDCTSKKGYSPFQLWAFLQWCCQTQMIGCSSVFSVHSKELMTMHQVISFSLGTIKHQDIACLCQADKDVLDSGCYGLKELNLGEEANPYCIDEPSWPEVIKQEKN